MSIVVTANASIVDLVRTPDTCKIVVRDRASVPVFEAEAHYEIDQAWPHAQRGIEKYLSFIHVRTSESSRGVDSAIIEVPANVFKTVRLVLERYQSTHHAKPYAETRA